MSSFSNMMTVSLVLACIAAMSYTGSAATLSNELESSTVNGTGTNNIETTAMTNQKQAKFSKFATSCGNWKNACKLSKNKTDYKMSCSKAVKKLKFVKGLKDFKEKISFCYSCRKHVCKGGSLVG
ncbi:uncharacterized protein LOC120338174 [Styela clava]